jgi:hypothetical protein
MTIHTFSYAELNAHLLGIAHNASANVLDHQSVVTFTFDVDASGTLVVTKSAPVITDNSQTIDVGSFASAIGLGDAGDILNRIAGTMATYVSNAVAYDETFLAHTLNNSGAWHYPGGKTFSFKQAEFSVHQDLITHVTYVDPS